MAKRTAVPKVSKRPNVGRALEEGEGILRLAPCWVPRSFLMPGRRLKLHPDDYYAMGAHRGGIDERWFASTTEAANDDREPDEGLSYVVHDGARFTLRDAVNAEGARLIGRAMWDKYKRWPVYSKFFDNLGPIAHHMHQDEKQAKMVGQEGKPEAYYFPVQPNNIAERVSAHVLRPRARHHQGGRPPVPGELEQGGQRHTRPFEGLPPQAGHRMARSPVHPPRPRFACNLRAPVGQRCLLNVPVNG